jgi:hypothetical protein
MEAPDTSLEKGKGQRRRPAGTGQLQAAGAPASTGWGAGAPAGEALSFIPALTTRSLAPPSLLSLLLRTQLGLGTEKSIPGKPLAKFLSRSGGRDGTEACQYICTADENIFSEFFHKLC